MSLKMRRAAEMFREVEIEVALQQGLQRLKQEEKELLVYLLALDIGKIALQIDCSVSNVYRKRGAFRISWKD